MPTDKTRIWEQTSSVEALMKHKPERLRAHFIYKGKNPALSKKADNSFSRQIERSPDTENYYCVDCSLWNDLALMSQGEGLCAFNKLSASLKFSFIAPPAQHTGRWMWSFWALRDWHFSPEWNTHFARRECWAHICSLVATFWSSWQEFSRSLISYGRRQSSLISNIESHGFPPGQSYWSN